MVFTNVLLIDRSVPDYEVFINALNENTGVILYSTETVNELIDLIQEKTTVAVRLGIVFVHRPYLETDDLFFDLVQALNITHVDFLACNLLNVKKWRDLFGRIQSLGVVVGASNDCTGNLKYGGDWVMESTGEYIALVYFTRFIYYYTYLLEPSKLDSL